MQKPLMLILHHQQDALRLVQLETARLSILDPDLKAMANLLSAIHAQSTRMSSTTSAQRSLMETALVNGWLRIT